VTCAHTEAIKSQGKTVVPKGSKLMDTSLARPLAGKGDAIPLWNRVDKAS